MRAMSTWEGLLFQGRFSPKEEGVARVLSFVPFSEQDRQKVLTQLLGGALLKANTFDLRTLLGHAVSSSRRSRHDDYARTCPDSLPRQADVLFCLDHPREKIDVCGRAMDGS